MRVHNRSLGADAEVSIDAPTLNTVATVPRVRFSSILECDDLDLRVTPASAALCTLKI